MTAATDLWVVRLRAERCARGWDERTAVAKLGRLLTTDVESVRARTDWLSWERGSRPAAAVRSALARLFGTVTAGLFANHTMTASHDAPEAKPRRSR